MQQLLDRVLEWAGRRLGIHFIRVIQHNHSPKALPPGSGGSIRCARLDSSQQEALSSDTGMDISPNWLSEASARGDTCFGVYVDDRLVAYDWRSTRSPVGMTDRLVVHFDESDSCYGFKMFTHPDYRGRGLQEWNLGFAEGVLMEQGIRRTMGYVDLTNRRSLRVMTKTGGVQVGWVGYWSARSFFLRIRSPGASRAGFDVGPAGERS